MLTGGGTHGRTRRLLGGRDRYGHRLHRGPGGTDGHDVDRAGTGLLGRRLLGLLALLGVHDVDQLGVMVPYQGDRGQGDLTHPVPLNHVAQRHRPGLALILLPRENRQERPLLSPDRGHAMQSRLDGQRRRFLGGDRRSGFHRVRSAFRFKKIPLVDLQIVVEGPRHLLSEGRLLGRCGTPVDPLVDLLPRGLLEMAPIRDQALAQKADARHQQQIEQQDSLPHVPLLVEMPDSGES